jgi:hypothetical protein
MIHKVCFFFILILLAATLKAAPSKADIINEMFRIECIPEIGVLKISEYFSNGYFPQESLKKNSDVLAKQYGIYSYKNNIIAIDDKTLIQSPKTSEFICTLNTKDEIDSPKFETYKINLTGIFENQSINGQCGLWRSFEVTISNSSGTILEKIPFGMGCSSPEFLKALTLYPHQGYLVPEGNCIFNNTLWLKNSPFSMADIYPSQAVLGQPEDMSVKPKDGCLY